MSISALPEHLHAGQYLKLRDFIPLERLTKNKKIFEMFSENENAWFFLENFLEKNTDKIDSRSGGVEDARDCRRSGVEDGTETRNSGNDEGVERVLEIIKHFYNYTKRIIRIIHIYYSSKVVI